MKFIADSMLGRLAKWLRLLGYDTLYYPSIEDSRLLRIAREEGRILLTRDTRLVRVRGVPEHLLLEENDPFDQLRIVINKFNLNIRPSPGSAGGISARCSLCNSLMVPASRKEAEGRVPAYVLRVCNEFRYCPACRKYYWPGTHLERMRERLATLFE
jgi:hypothetical protein